MRRLVFFLAAIFIFFGCGNGQITKTDMHFAELPKPRAGEEVADFGGGCFWSMSEALSELKGVNKVIAGFAGGDVKNPTYEDVCTNTTGHAEVVQVYYDPKVVSYAELAEAFFYAHDPTTLNRQGPDEGTDYRSIAFYRTSEEKKALDEAVAKVNVSKRFSNKAVTEIVPFKVFYPAEKYHQGYYQAHTYSPYIMNVSEPKVEHFEKMMHSYLKPEFQ